MLRSAPSRCSSGTVATGWSHGALHVSYRYAPLWHHEVGAGELDMGEHMTAEEMT